MLFRGTLLLALGALTTVGVLNWRAQLQTQQKLDALAAALAAQHAAPSSPVPPAPSVPSTPTAAVPEPGAIPRELNHVSLPPYVIDAPDVLLIDVVLKDRKTGTTDRLPDQPISGPFVVRPDGTVGLGLWGSVSVSGSTIDQTGEKIRAHLAKSPRVDLAAKELFVVVDVQSYNSKRYYVITDRAGSGEQIHAFPVTGNETVLDAIVNVNGLSDNASKSTIWVARARDNGRTPQTLPVDWRGITQNGITTTNYQLLPGDRVYVKQASK